MEIQTMRCRQEIRNSKRHGLRDWHTPLTLALIYEPKIASVTAYVTGKPLLLLFLFMNE